MLRRFCSNAAALLMALAGAPMQSTAAEADAPAKPAVTSSPGSSPPVKGDWQPYSARCAGKSECGPTDVVEIRAEVASALALSVATLVFDADKTIEVPIGIADTSQPKAAAQVLASFPLAPNLLEWVQSAGGKHRQILLDAPNAKVLTKVRMGSGASAHLVPLSLDVSSLWVSGALGLKIGKVTCNQPCNFTSTVTLDVPHWPAWALATKGAPAKLNLYLDGLKIPEVTATPVVAAGNENAKLVFTLRRLADKPDSVNAWSTVMTKALGSTGENAKFDVGIGDERGILASSDKAIGFDVASAWPRGLAIWGTLGGLLILLLLIGRKPTASFCRDDYPVPDDLKVTRSYSLGRVQMLWWTCVVVAAMVGVFVSTGEAFALNETCLVLIGIGAATAAGAIAVVPARVAVLTAKLEKAKADLAAVPSADAPGTQAAKKKVDDIIVELKDAVGTGGFRKDITRNVGDGTAGLHRLQNIAFALIMGFWFLAVLYTCGSMPTVSTTMLALMGISGSAYVGFKMAG